MINAIVKGLGEDAVSIFVAIIGIVVTIVLNIKRKVCTLTMDNSLNSILYAFDYMRKTIFVILIIGEIWCLVISLGNEIGNKTLVIFIGFFIHVLMLFILIAYPIINAFKLQKLCGKYFKEVVHIRTTIYFCAIFNIFYGCFVLKYSESLAHNSKISEGWSGNNEIYNVRFNNALCGLQIIIFIYLCTYICLFILEDDILNVTAEQYEKIVICLNKTGMLYKFSRYDKVFACDDARGILIINNEDRLKFSVPDGKGSYRVIESDNTYPLFIKYDDIEYIRDHRGREVLFGDKLE